MSKPEEKKQEVIHSKIWQEVPEPDNPFAAATCYCSGYDVYGDLLGKISWIEYLYLLFKLEPPTKDQARLLEGIAVAIANPGPRDLSVRAAMNGGVGGATAAACLMAAMAPGAGQFGGAREVALVMNVWHQCGTDFNLWRMKIKSYKEDESEADIWPGSEHFPGFDPYSDSCAGIVINTLDHLSSFNDTKTLQWLQQCRSDLESTAGGALSMTGVIATAFVDLDLSPDQGEMLFLLLRLPGAAVHALEQKANGWRQYPFFSEGLTLTNDPGSSKKASDH